MAATLPKDSALSPRKTVQSRMAKVHVASRDVQARAAELNAHSGEPLTDVINKPEILALIRESMAAVGLKEGAAAAIAGVKPSQFSAALSGKGNFGATWLWAQDNRFLDHFFEAAKSARRITPESTSAVRRRRIVELIELLLRECS